MSYGGYLGDLAYFLSMKANPVHFIVVLDRVFSLSHCKMIMHLTMGVGFKGDVSSISQRKKISNNQELIQSDPISCPQNKKGK